MRMKGVSEAVKKYEKQLDDWGKDDPELNSNLVGYGTASGLLVGVGLIGAPAILALSAYGGYKMAVGARDATYERFLVRRMHDDPEFVDELRAKVEEAQSK